MKFWRQHLILCTLQTLTRRKNHLRIGERPTKTWKYYFKDIIVIWLQRLFAKL